MYQVAARNSGGGLEWVWVCSSKRAGLFSAPSCGVHGAEDGPARLKFPSDPRATRPKLPRADTGEMLKAVEHDLAAEAMALDIEQAGGIGLVAAGDFQDAGN